jgi:hypothetical protein
MVANLENIQKIYSDYPDSFIFNGVRIDNYSKSENHYLHGWRNVVIPEITEYQKLGNLYVLVDEVVTREVIDFTPEEVDENNFSKLKEGVSKFLEKKKQDGIEYFNNFEIIITIQLAGILITELVAITNEIDTILYKPLNLIKNGDFFSAMMLFNNPATITPTIPLVLNHWNDIKVFTQNYFLENYPQEPIV